MQNLQTEATWVRANGKCFSNFVADCILIYYMALAKAHADAQTAEAKPMENSQNDILVKP